MTLKNTDLSSISVIVQRGLQIHPGKSLLADPQWLEIARQLKLTDRELEVCRRMFEGMTRQETAESMDIKIRTVRHYMEQLHSKMNVSNRVELVLKIIQLRDMLVSNKSPPQ